MSFLSPNLASSGRRARAQIGLILLLAAAPGFWLHAVLGFTLLGGGLFALFEAYRGWCLLRACGIKTRL